MADATEEARRRVGQIKWIDPVARMYRENGEELRIGDEIRGTDTLTLKIETWRGYPETFGYTVVWRDGDGEP